MALARDLDGQQEADAFAARLGHETDKIAIAANVGLPPDLKEAAVVADLWRYGDAVTHDYKGLKKTVKTKGRILTVLSNHTDGVLYIKVSRYAFSSALLICF